ncbi:uncharacterized protein LOC126765213 isoform X2 [Bactrocera neohumeralis]|uniref:uncharacterized protein LOC126765213 isoform X2 n=1 Tax=Bactrocera neohumeralis TaxID=98809 RepID=UPI00216648CF|nr:uncharacterized protein LOC126765213 isoform X2 [Bactrocera neohumeralis]
MSPSMSPSAKQIDSSVQLDEFEYALSGVSGKTPGLDKISYPMIKNLPIELKQRIVKLYNKILDTGIYPQFWKTSGVIPILKPNKESTDIDSYRPISLLPCLGKLFEKIIANRLSWYAQRNKLMTPNQVGYKRSQGTLDVLLHLDHSICNALSSRNHLSILSLDFNKAFDKIGAHIVLRQLKNWKIGPKILNFVKSFLTNRKLKVNVNGFFSSTLPLSNGTPQGSPLSTFLFITAFDEIIFDSKYNFNSHCKYIRNSLQSRLNIVKYLSSKYSLIHPNTLISVVRSLLLSKIDYALPLYGRSSKNNIKLICAPYHCAIRRSLRAFPTSPIEIMLAESGLPSVQNRIVDETHRLLSKAVESTNSSLTKAFATSLRRTRLPRFLSAITKCVIFAKKNALPLSVGNKVKPLHPHWLIPCESLPNKLSKLPKQNTPNDVYKKTFLEMEHEYEKNGWKSIFTDGSKSSEYTSFSVVTNTEASAILKAVEHAKKHNGKYLICTDSKSCISAIKSLSNYNPIISKIRDAVISAPRKIKIMWIPGHVGITGNHLADAAAKSVKNIPALTYNYLSKQDIRNFIKHKRLEENLNAWKLYTHSYAIINPDRIPTVYGPTTKISAIKAYTRLRIGHTILTHSHILMGKSRSNCPFCDNSVSIQHILADCPVIHSTTHYSDNIDLAQALKNPSDKNVMNTYKFLKDRNLLKYI